MTVRGSGLYESRDGGSRWQCLNGNLPAIAAEDPRGLICGSVSSNHIVLALGGTPENGAGIYKTQDGGHNWERLNQEPLFGDITSLVDDPANRGTVYVTTRESFERATSRALPGGVFRSTDAGKTWQHILDYHYASAIVVSPADSRTLYVGTTDHPFHDNAVAEGVLKSSDGGLTWQRQNQGLTHLNISCLSINPHAPAILYAGTGGNGLFIGLEKTASTNGTAIR